MTTTNTISQAHIDLCTRLINPDTGEVYYRVASESTDAVYEVHHIAGRGFTCTCPAGQEGFAHCFANPTCKHCRWSVEHARLYKAEQAALAERNARAARLMSLGLTEREAYQAASATAIINGQPATDEELARIYGPRQARPTDAEVEAMAEAYEARPFNLLK